MAKFVISDISTGKLNALVKNIMSATGVADPAEAVRMVNAGEVSIKTTKPFWRTKKDLTYFTVTSDGVSGIEWLNFFKIECLSVNGDVVDILKSQFFVPTADVEYEVIILNRSRFPSRVNLREVRDYAQRSGLEVPPLEVACLVREKVSNKDMLQMGHESLIVMHEPLDPSISSRKTCPGLLTPTSIRRVGYTDMGSSRSNENEPWGPTNKFGYVFIRPLKQ